MKKQVLIKQVIVLAALLLLVLGSIPAMAADAQSAKNDQNAKKMTMDDATAVLKHFDPSIQVKSVEPAPIDGLWEVIVTVKGEVGIVYIASDQKHVILGSIVDVINKANLTKARFDAVKSKYEPKVDFSSIPLDDAVVLGNPDAKTKVVVFDDPS